MKVGTFITCENGHVVAEVLEDIYPGDMNYTRKVGNWRIFEEPDPGDRDPRCGCNARFWSVDHGYHTEAGWSF